MKLNMKQDLNLLYQVLGFENQDRYPGLWLIEKGEKSLTSRYGLVLESPDILHYDKATFTVI